MQTVKWLKFCVTSSRQLLQQFFFWLLPPVGHRDRSLVKSFNLRKVLSWLFGPRQEKPEPEQQSRAPRSIDSRRLLPLSFVWIAVRTERLCQRNTDWERVLTFYRLEPLWHDRKGFAVRSSVLITSFTTSRHGTARHATRHSVFAKSEMRLEQIHYRLLKWKRQKKKKHLTRSGKKKLLRENRERQRERLWSNRCSWKVIRCQRSSKWSSVSQGAWGAPPHERRLSDLKDHQGQ